MSEAELLASYDHLATCEACRLTLSAAAKPQQAFGNFLTALETEGETEIEHLSYERIAAYVDDELDTAELAIALSHLQICSACEMRAAELQEFKTALTASVTDPRAPQTPPTLREKISALWSLSPRWSPLRLAGALALVVVCVLAATVFLRRQAADLSAGRLKETKEDPKKTAVNVSDKQTELAGPGHRNENPQRANQGAKDAGDDHNASPPQAVTNSSDRNSSGNSAALLALNDGGGQVNLDQHGNVTGVGSLSPADAQAVRSALTTGKVETAADLPELIGRSQAITRGSGNGVAFALVSPVGTVVQSDLPIFRWRELAGATAYVVNIYDSSFNQVASSPELPGTEWTASTPLAAGRVYLWQVTAIRNGERIKSPATPAPEARFRILEVAAATALEHAQASYRNSHLMLGILYLRAGILPEAEHEFHTLLLANPRSPIALRLWRNVRRLRGA